MAQASGNAERLVDRVAAAPLALATDLPSIGPPASACVGAPLSSAVPAMRIGVISDTHNNIANVERIVELLNAAGVTRVVHTGDITQAKTLHALAGLRAPLVAVYGNNDVERTDLDQAARSHGMELFDGPLELHWAERRILVVHDPADLAGALEDGHELALHGHNHRHVAEWQRNCLVFNPGECAGHMAGCNAVGVVDLTQLSTSLLRF